MQPETKKIVIFGTGKMGRLAHFYFTQDSSCEIVAFTVDKPYVTGNKFCGCPVVPFENVQDAYPTEDYRMFVAMGYTKLNSIRALKYHEAKQKGYNFVSYVSQRSFLAPDAAVGENCFILENQVIQTGVTIGNDVFVWSGNHIGHDVKIGDHCYITSHVVLSGSVTVGDYSFIGVNATLRDNIAVAEKCIIGAGALILRSTKPKEVYVAKGTARYPLDSSEFESMMEISRS